ncbi:MarR family transcriptional regulator|uniref:Transcriptional regulator, MarR family n=1 Tax=Dendrosporobacter quercicolus TaxID=146817 RepID=A0A1G9LCU7_9FIRM|nr:MarR family transcriptional regulator [Dendrosporobacter quercicolus]NSL46670.1 MarR family transcriptional regulator [Dendrosporobacter quercicolus DSM 1736]SDL59676.1 transcriptional regulator, MarR family [Dendrosporobacter quercicolus]
MLEIFDSLCILLAKAEQKHFLYTKKALDEAKLEISPGQLVVLYALYKKDNISISELSKKVFLDNSTLTGLIDRLERLELVKRVDVPHDRRSYQICLTDKARRIEQRTKQVMQQIENKMLENCSESEITALRSILGRIFTNF